MRGQWREFPGRVLIQTPRSHCSPQLREQCPAARGCCNAAVLSLRSSAAPLSPPSSSLDPPVHLLSSHRREYSPPGTEHYINNVTTRGADLSFRKTSISFFHLPIINYLVFALHLLCVVLTVCNKNSLHKTETQLSNWPFRSVYRWHRIFSRQEDRVLVRWPWPGLLSRTNWGEERGKIEFHSN